MRRKSRTRTRTRELPRAINRARRHHMLRVIKNVTGVNWVGRQMLAVVVAVYHQ